MISHTYLPIQLVPLCPSAAAPTDHIIQDGGFLAVPPSPQNTQPPQEIEPPLNSTDIEWSDNGWY